MLQKDENTTFYDVLLPMELIGYNCENKVTKICLLVNLR